MQKLEWDHVTQAAKAFVRAKGKMPWDFHELVAWLVEFDSVKNDMLKQSIKNFEDHIALCNRPIII